jgi:predicted transcriptional regulator
MEKTTLYLPSDLQHALRVRARRTGRSQASLLREAIGEYVRRQERPPLRSLGLGENETVHPRDAEAWLETNYRSA